MRFSVASAAVVRLQFQQRHDTTGERHVELEVPGAPVHAVRQGCDSTLCGEPLAGMHTFEDKEYGDIRPDNRCPDCHNAFLFDDLVRSRPRTATD